MFSKAYSAAIHGIDGLIVSVEADVSDGLPIFDLVGYLSSEVKEARERVRIALKNSGYMLPAKRITVNLSPADIHKEGTAFDLSIAIAILAAFGHLPEENLSNYLIIGELSLNGNVNKVNGVLPIVYSAKQQGFTKCIVPKDNAGEGAVVDKMATYGVSTLAQAVELLSGRGDYNPEYVDVGQLLLEDNIEDKIDFAEVAGQKAAKRAIEIAASGMHNILLICCYFRAKKNAVFKHFSLIY